MFEDGLNPDASDDTVRERNMVAIRDETGDFGRIYVERDDVIRELLCTVPDRTAPNDEYGSLDKVRKLLGHHRRPVVSAPDKVAYGMTFFRVSGA